MLKRKSPVNQRLTGLLGGERGIRTPGTSRYGSFQDYCNRPLYHLSKIAREKKIRSGATRNRTGDTRIFSPLLYQLSYGTSKKSISRYCCQKKWCHQESNRGHKDFQSFALPTELWHLADLRVQKYNNYLISQNFARFFYQSHYFSTWELVYFRNNKHFCLKTLVKTSM